MEKLQQYNVEKIKPNQSSDAKNHLFKMRVARKIHIHSK